ncbi:conserved hypothetical protein [Trichophyton verrucosum HKI 0517]|uniref:FAD-binding FR-type domain-containing protein n=1 Tax=Trichophyton verrucosum (strain HKI 0517) TaxID=663202 RepID=D4D3G8_TRIVH|nr:uncharacterized protein TRV_01628 [Trichophyton verrucosum HKI 0517]EFE43584.1 conserved hypothetical protein [Trichophyton verrucosum HKI 0517]
MSAQGSKPHELRTATEPRQNSLYKLRVSYISQVNPTIRLIRFNNFCGCASLDWSKDNSEDLTYNQQPPLEFLPGQWLDVHIPNIKHAGGFTITSTHQDASTQGDIDGNDNHLPYVELAVQYSPSNPAAKWFWQPIEQILGAYVKVRIGGGFVWPPPNGMALDEIKNIVFVAGGVGIKIPSPSTPINMARPGEAVKILATDRPSKILFLDRLLQISRDWNRAKDNADPIDLQLFLANSYLENRGGNKVDFHSSILDTDKHITVHSRRIEASDLHKAVGESDELRSGTICYVCGPPVMTDEFVKELETFIGSEDDKTRGRVLYEKWW